MAVYYHTFGHSKQDLSVPKKFMRRAREKKAAGEDYRYWVRAARIINHIELNIPVGFDRLRRGRKPRRQGMGAA
jgi:ribosomal protein S19E (S16A)